MENLAVSVIISIYNGEKYLSECLESILAQSLGNIEIICVDDASTDATPLILDKYKDRIRILTNDKNCMAGESRNRGLDAAEGEYVIFLDADDIFEPGMLEHSYHKAQHCNADICIFKEDIFTDSSAGYQSYPYAELLMKRLGEKEFFSPSELSDILFNLWNGWAWDKLFRRKFVLDTGIRFPNIQTSEDGFFVHAAMAAADRISFLNEVLVHHRTGNGSSLSNTRDGAWESCLLYMKKLMQYLKRSNLFSVYERSYVNWAADFLYWNYWTLSNKNRELLADKMKYFFFEIFAAGHYEENYFYNAFSYRFAYCIVNSEVDNIPIAEEAYHQKVYQLNVLKMERLYQYVSANFPKLALWGAGVRGRAFAKVYGKDWTGLQNIYDMDYGKQGQELCSGLVVEPFDREHNEADCILVLNAAHVKSVYGMLRGECVVLFDMNSYLTLPFEIEDCLIDCSTSK